MAALGHYHDAVVLAVVVVVFEQRADVIDVDLVFGYEDHVGAAGHAGGHRDPAGVAAHHFDDDDAIVRVGSGVDAVDGLRGDHDGRVVAECRIGAADIVVGGFGDTYARYAVLTQKQRDRLRVVAAEGDERVDFVGLQNLLDLFDAA